MAHEEGSVTVERPINIVFDFVADGMNNPLWRTTVTDIQRVLGKPNTFKQGMKGPTGRVDGDYEISEIKPNERIMLKAIAGMARPTVTYTFESAGTATRVICAMHFEGKGYAKLLDPIVTTIMRAEIGMLPNLKAYLEKQA